jgi:hypothetical protein
MKGDPMKFEKGLALAENAWNAVTKSLPGEEIVVEAGPLQASDDGGMVRFTRPFFLGEASDRQPEGDFSISVSLEDGFGADLHASYRKGGSTHLVTFNDTNFAKKDLKLEAIELGSGFGFGF